MSNTQVETIETTVAGSYFKKTSRVGVAHTTISESGELSYTNRRGEVRSIEVAEFNKFWALGYNSLNARNAVHPLNEEAQLNEFFAETTEVEQTEESTGHALADAVIAGDVSIEQALVSILS